MIRFRRVLTVEAIVIFCMYCVFVYIWEETHKLRDVALPVIETRYNAPILGPVTGVNLFMQPLKGQTFEVVMVADPIYGTWAAVIHDSGYTAKPKVEICTMNKVMLENMRIEYIDEPEYTQVTREGL